MMLLHVDKDTSPHVAEIGGKCANLARLHQQGFNVPKTMALTTAAYEEHALQCRLAETVGPLIKKSDWAEVERVAHDAICGHRLDAELINTILEQYDQMGNPPVAVRSSATSEDIQDTSAAGQYESYLDIRDEKALLAAIQKCWASLWTRRVLSYRQRQGVDHFSVRMAVIIQKMVPAEAAGVLFTRDPLQPNDNHIRIEAVPGLGEALVSGEIAGDVYRVCRTSLGKTQNLNKSELLSPPLIEELCAVALRVEEHFGYPQDIEFAVASNTLHILQARPITGMNTTKLDSLEPLGKPSFIDKMIKPFADERYVIAPRPLDLVVVNHVLGAHLYAIKKGGACIKKEDEEKAMARLWRQAYRLPTITRIWKMYYKGVPQIFRQLNENWLDWWESGPSEELRTFSEALDLSTLDDERLFARADKILNVWQRLLYKRIYASGGVHAGSWLRLLVTLAVGLHRRDEIMAKLMTGIDTPTLNLNRQLWQISRLIRQHPDSLAAIREEAPHRLTQSQEGREILAAFQSFIDEHGHREGACWYLTTPTWRNDQKQVWRILLSLVDANEQSSGPEHARAPHMNTFSLVERRLRFIPGLKRLFGWLWRSLYRLNAFREKSHYDLTRGIDALQRIVHECAERLQARGVVQRESDVGYLTYEELREWTCGKSPDAEIGKGLLDRRRATYRLVNTTWQAQRSGPPAKGHVLKGIAASPGIVRGRARIIRGEHDFGKLRAGEVLVCPYTNPAWTPLFSMAAAVVTETGGLSSHAAIVAREYGIPAVMCVHGATRTLKQNQDVRVDGTRGHVYPPI